MISSGLAPLEGKRQHLGEQLFLVGHKKLSSMWNQTGNVPTGSQTKIPGRPTDVWDREFVQGQSLRPGIFKDTGNLQVILYRLLPLPFLSPLVKFFLKKRTYISAGEPREMLLLK